MKNSELMANFERLEAVLRAGFQRTDARFDHVDIRLGEVDARLDGIDGRLDGIDIRLAGIDGRLDRLEAQVHHLRDTTAEHFEVLEMRLNERLDRLEQRV